MVLPFLEGNIYHAANVAYGCGRYNNGMHPTLASEALIIELADFCYLACGALASGG